MDIESRRKLFKGGRFVFPMQRPEIRTSTEERLSLRRKEAAIVAQETKRKNLTFKQQAIRMNPDYRIYVETTSEQSASKIENMASKLEGVVRIAATSSFERNVSPRTSQFFPNTKKEVFQMEFHANEIDGNEFLDYIKKIPNAICDVY